MVQLLVFLSKLASGESILLTIEFFILRVKDNDLRFDTLSFRCTIS